MVSFGEGIPDVVNILVYIEDGLKLLIDGFGAFFDLSNYVEMRDMGAEFESALTRYQSRQPGGPVDELGEAVSQNAQSKLFATAARRKARNSGIDRSVDLVATSAHLTGTALMATGVASVAGAVLKGASSFISFLGKGLDRIINFGSLKNDIEFILGDRELLNTPKFRTVLKEETGINNENYIPDLAKVFAAIDTHVLLQNNSSPGEQQLAKSIANRILGEHVEIDENTYKKLLIAVGAPSNWRNVLLESISS